MKSGPCMQCVHASFAFGAFIAPLIAKPFIQDVPNAEEDSNSSIHVSCNLTEMSYCNDKSSVTCLCDDTISEACNKTASAAINIYYNNITNCSVVEDESVTLQYGWAYWITAMFLIIPLISFTYYAIRYDTTFSLKRKRTQTDDSLEISQEEDGEDLLVNDDNEQSNAITTSSKTYSTYKYPAFILLFLFTFSYVGSEASYGSLVFIYAVEGELGFDKSTAAILTAVFWGPFTFARFFSIILAVLKVRASVMMTMNVSGSCVAILILVIFPHNHIVIWIASALLGASFASIYPTTMTWLSQHVPVSGKATAVVVSGGNLGNIIAPSAVTALVGSVNPDSFVYFIFAFIVLSTALLAMLFVITAVYKRRHKPDVGSVKYRKLQKISTESPENGSVSQEQLDLQSEGEVEIRTSHDL